MASQVNAAPWVAGVLPRQGGGHSVQPLGVPLAQEEGGGHGVIMYAAGEAVAAAGSRLPGGRWVHLLRGQTVT